jgi:putative ABC transport system permease protein
LKGNAKTYGDIAVYSPMKPDDLPGADLVVSVSGDPLRLVPSLKAQVWAIDPTLPVTKITTLDAAMAEKMSRPRFNLVLLASFAGVGLLLAAIGIYGVISASVAQRTQEIGVRMALGALPRDIRRAVVGEALVLAGVGLASGIGLALALTRVMRAMLYETSAADPAAIGGTLGLLAATALVAAWVPARRAMRVDPMVALRSE